MELPVNYVHESVVGVLQNRKKYICDAFIWGYTPQGADFWYAEDQRLHKGMPVSDEARIYLEKCVELYKKRKGKSK